MIWDPPVRCPECNLIADSLSREAMSGPAFLNPCGHYVLPRMVGRRPHVQKHPEYSGLRHQDVQGDVWTNWRLSIMHEGKPVADPPRAWIETHLKEDRGKVETLDEEPRIPNTVEELHRASHAELAKGTQNGVARAQVYAILALSAPTMSDGDIADALAVRIGSEPLNP